MPHSNGQKHAIEDGSASARPLAIASSRTIHDGVRTLRQQPPRPRLGAPPGVLQLQRLGRWGSDGIPPPAEFRAKSVPLDEAERPFLPMQSEVGGAHSSVPFTPNRAMHCSVSRETSASRVATNFRAQIQVHAWFHVKHCSDESVSSLPSVAAQ